ncbi:unnamed protein product, partial [Coregonus sp. 'balchen']
EAMGGLGNGRRGGRTPPLMIGALIACVLVLGFNYWTKLYELEAQMRRAASERGAVEVKKNEFQEEIQRLKEESSRMQSLNKRLEGVHNTCSQEKASQQINISSSTKTIQDLKTSTQKIGSTEVGVSDKEGPGKAGLDDTKTTPVHGHAPEPSVAKGPAADLKASELETNEIAVDKALDAPALSPQESLPSTDANGDQPGPVEEAEGASKPQKNNLTTEDTELEVMDTHGGELQIEDADPGADDIQLSQWKEEEAPIGQEKVEDPEEDPDKRNQMAENIEFQLEAAEQVLDHDAQVVVEDPGPQAGQVLSLGLQLHQQAVQRRIHLLCLQVAPPHRISQPQEFSNIHSIVLGLNAMFDAGAESWEEICRLLHEFLSFTH